MNRGYLICSCKATLTTYPALPQNSREDADHNYYVNKLPPYFPKFQSKMSNNTESRDSKSVASKYTVVSWPDMNNTNEPLPRDKTVVEEDETISKPATSRSAIDMPQDLHDPSSQPISQVKVPSPSTSSTSPLQRIVVISSPQPQTSLTPSPSLPLSSTQPTAHDQPPDSTVDAITSRAVTRERSSLPPPPLPSIPIHVKRDMQQRLEKNKKQMRMASTSQKEMFQFFPQVPAVGAEDNPQNFLS